MKWRKLGRIFVPDGSLWWARRRAYLPTPQVRGSTIRVYYSALDEGWVGRVGYVDLDAKDPTKVLYEAREPIFSAGSRGAFDEHGVTPSCVLDYGDETWMFYYGWQRVQGVPPLMFTGLAYLDGESFQRWQNTPILERQHREMFSRAGSFVLDEDGRFRMWYNARHRWLDLTSNPLFGKEQATYDIRYLKSGNVSRWQGPSQLAVGLKGDDEFGLARPWVIKESPFLYRMWYAIRTYSHPYRLGYAESEDGHAWKRKDDEVGIIWSESGWDSEMICFAAVVDAGGERYMFYNGNGHGETGFGAAVLERG